MEEEQGPISIRSLDRIYDIFRRDLERTFKPGALTPWEWELPSFFGEARDSRLALWDLVDRGDWYEPQIEVPRIEKEKIDVKANPAI